MIKWAELDDDSKVIFENITFPVSEHFHSLVNDLARPTPDARYWNRKFKYVDRAIAATKRLFELGLIELVERQPDGHWRSLDTDEGREVIAERDNWWQYSVYSEADDPEWTEADRPPADELDRPYRDIEISSADLTLEMMNDGTFHLLGDTSTPGVYIISRGPSGDREFDQVHVFPYDPRDDEQPTPG